MRLTVIAQRFSKELVAKLYINSRYFVLKRCEGIDVKLWRENEPWFRDCTDTT